MSVPWIAQLVEWLAQAFHANLFQVRGPIALALVAVACGMLGSLVVGNRMAFFSDAMAHTAFAGVTLSLLGLVVMFGVTNAAGASKHLWVVPLVMAAVGVAAGLLIVFIQERTSLTADTVIGVFFALSLGFAGLLLPTLRQRVNLNPEDILFGQVLLVGDFELAVLFGLAAVTAGVVLWKYNSFVLGSFNPSLAASRGLGVRRNNYLFVVLLALVVNLSIYAVGVLLINALLVVPAAAAANVSRNLRRMFWFTFAGAVGCAAAGYWMSTTVHLSIGTDKPLDLNPSGAVVVACVGWFVASLGLRAIRRRFFGAPDPCSHTSCSHTHGGGEYTHAH